MTDPAPVLAFGTVQPRGSYPRVCAKVGPTIYDVSGEGAEFRSPTLNAFIGLGPSVWRTVIEDVRRGAYPSIVGDELLALDVGDFTDFSSSRAHVELIGQLSGSGGAPANFDYHPVAYNGRSSTIVASGTDIMRPRLQQFPQGDGPPAYVPDPALDLEMELAMVVGVPTRRGEPVGAADAMDHIFGVTLLNDWTARAGAIWEARPLGPLLCKSFATTLGNWIVPMSELTGRICHLPEEGPPSLPHLAGPRVSLDFTVELVINGTCVARSSPRHLTWGLNQLVAHLTSNGLNLRVGDVIATGTISGFEPDQRVCLAELSMAGKETWSLANGEERTWLLDGDVVTLSAPELDLLVEGRIVPPSRETTRKEAA
ncbi:fumarylacetoacetate hydrolase family protein [Streptomyces sp. YKOK-I1]